MKGWLWRQASFLLVLTTLQASLSLALTLDEFNGQQSTSANPTTISSFSAATNPGIAGGNRKIKLTWLNGPNAPSSDTDAIVVTQDSEGSFLYSQDAAVVAQCLLSWDGTSSPGAAISLAPGGLNLLQDNGNAFIIEVQGNDLQAQLELTVTDATNASKTSKAVANLAPGGARSITIPFSTLSGDANLETAGAISLLINKGGTEALDLSIAKISTNGICNLVPNSSGQVIDECGVCGGNNSSCADCAGIPNGSTVVDQCGVCGGNGSSCLDCLGVPNGPAVLDRCNVCNGNGSSCLECTSSDITFLLATMDASAKSQEALIKNIYQKIEKSTSRRATLRTISALRKQAHALQIRNWTLSWTIPRISTTCANKTFCVSVTNSKYIEEYRKNSESLRQMTVDALKLWQKVNKSARKHVPSYLKSAAKLHAHNEQLLKQVPASQSVCT